MRNFSFLAGYTDPDFTTSISSDQWLIEKDDSVQEVIAQSDQNYGPISDLGNSRIVHHQNLSLTCQLQCANYVWEF